jgi:hypothetical protein
MKKVREKTPRFDIIVSLSTVGIGVRYYANYRIIGHA